MEGKSVDQVLSEMGTPKEVAERFNQEMKSPSKRKNFWSVIIVCVLGGIVLAGILGSMWFRFFKQQAVSIVGGADGPDLCFYSRKTRLEWIPNFFHRVYFWLYLCRSFM